MEHWRNLSLFKKFIFGMLAIIGVLLLPELIFFMHVGGIELIFGFMVMYIQSMRTWLEIKRQSFKRIINTIYASLLSTTAFKPRTFYLQSTFCVIAFVVTGSISLSMVFFMPGMLLNNLSV